MDKKLANAVVISVVVTAVICYIIYLQDEKNKLLNDNDLLKRRIIDDESKTGHNNTVINVKSIPTELRQEFRSIIEHPTTEAKTSYKESYDRIIFLKDFIENRDGYKLFYHKNEPYLREKDIQFLYKLVWCKTEFDVNSEVNNGRGHVDFKVSKGLDQTLIEFKLASNTRLKSNLQKQTDIYLKANPNAKKIIVIVFVNDREKARLETVLAELKLTRKRNIISVDARQNKVSASAA